jgi:hypothetical protein
MLIPFVAVMLGGLLVFIGATTLTSSTTARTAARVSDLRLLIDAGQAALAGSIQQVRAALVAELAAPASGPSWRGLLLPPYRGREKPERAMPAPLAERFSGELDLELSTVSLRVADWFEPADSVPQGLLEVEVTAQMRRPYGTIRRRIVERRVFYVTSGAAGGDVTIGTTPVGRLILP